MQINKRKKKMTNKLKTKQNKKTKNGINTTTYVNKIKQIKYINTT
jgi:hypothetical protein